MTDVSYQTDRLRRAEDRIHQLEMALIGPPSPPFVVGDPNSVAFDMAALLARIHKVDLADVAGLGLRHRAGDVADRL